MSKTEFEKASYEYAKKTYSNDYVAALEKTGFIDGADWAYQWFTTEATQRTQVHISLEQKLAIAVEALEHYNICSVCTENGVPYLKNIHELKPLTEKINEALAKIKGEK